MIPFTIRPESLAHVTGHTLTRFTLYFTSAGVTYNAPHCRLLSQPTESFYRCEACHSYKEKNLCI